MKKEIERLQKQYKDILGRHEIVLQMEKSDPLDNRSPRCYRAFANLENGKYYVDADIIHNDGYDYFMEVPKEKFKEVLKTTFEWIPTGWDKELAKEYEYLLDLVR